jgi:uncharacterized protein
MMRSKAISSIVVTLIGLLVSTGALSADRPPTLITIGTAGKAGIYYPAGGAICKLVNENRFEHGIRCLAESTEGSIYNLQALRAGNLDLALAQSDWQYHALNGTDAFAEVGPDTELRAVFSLHQEPFTVVARRDSGIRQFSDLKGKRVNVGPRGSGNRATTDIVFAAMGWTVDDLALATELPSDEQARALCDDRIDAVIFIVGHPNRSIQDTITSCDAILVPVTGPAIDLLVAEHPYYWDASIPRGMYKGTSEAVKTFGLGATLVASSRTPPPIVYEIVKAVFENLDEFKELHPAFANLDKTRMVNDGLSARIHPGALRYYWEKGLK